MASDILLFETGDDCCCYAFCHGESRSIQKIVYSVFEPDDDDSIIAGIIKQENVTADRFHKIYVSIASPQALLVPEKYFKIESADKILRATFHLDKVHVKYDIVRECQLVTVYALPNNMSHLNIEGAECLHAFTASIKKFKREVSDTWVSLHFTPKRFRVIAKKNGLLQLAQFYNYTAPLDVIYYLITIFNQLHLSQTATTITISGLIEKDSALYKELYKYFLDISFEEPAANQILQEQYPQHFFTSIYNLAACVL